MRRAFTLVLALALVTLVIAPPLAVAAAQPDAAQLQQMLRKLTVVGSAIAV